MALGCIVKSDKYSSASAVTERNDFFCQAGFLALLCQPTKPIFDLDVQAFLKVIDQRLDLLVGHNRIPRFLLSEPARLQEGLNAAR